MSLRSAAFVLLAVAPALAAGNYASEWSPSAKSRARLIADGHGAGFQISLAPGTITYWRDPGEAGVPPTFDFSASENLAHAEVEFPAPERIPESDGSVAFGYREGVVLPIRATPADPAKPVRLVAKVDYAVCEKICLPAKATAEISLQAEGASPFTDDLSKARAEVPAKASAAGLGVTIAVSGAKAWRLCLAEAPRDLFVEAPEGFWIEPKRDSNPHCFALALQQAPADAKGPIPLRLTVETASGASEAPVELQE